MKTKEDLFNDLLDYLDRETLRQIISECYRGREEDLLDKYTHEWREEVVPMNKKNLIPVEQEKPRKRIFVQEAIKEILGVDPLGGKGDEGLGNIEADEEDNHLPVEQEEKATGALGAFVDYVWSFYGPGELYGDAFGDTLEKSEVVKAVKMLIQNKGYEFAADSVDREFVRDIMLANRGETDTEYDVSKFLSTASHRTAQEDDDTDEDREAPPTLEELKKQVHSWDAFERGRSNNAMSVEDFIKGVKDGFSDLYESNNDYITDTAFEGVDYILKENGIDPEDYRDNHPEDYDELRFAVEEAMDFNVSEFFPRGELFVYDTTEFDAPEMYDLADYKESDEYQEFLTEAKKYGFTQEQFDKSLAEASYGGVGGVGVLVSPSDIDDLAAGREKSITGTPILYIRDRINGSGWVEFGKGSKEVTGPIDKIQIDHGSYSLGDVFGSTEWAWR
jgi:nucleotide-binding universal stress UspA family protein